MTKYRQFSGLVQIGMRNLREHRQAPVGFTSDVSVHSEQLVPVAAAVRAVHATERELSSDITRASRSPKISTVHIQIVIKKQKNS